MNRKDIWVNLRMFVFLSFLTGVLYPLLITLIAQLTMPFSANGSFVSGQDRIAGSLLIGQKMENPKYLWSRPSAIDYKPLPSGGSNLSLTSKTLKKNVDERRAALASAHSIENHSLIPAELLFSSASGLDPHISLHAANFQIERVAKARGMDKAAIEKLVHSLSEGPQYGLFGPPFVNGLKLNLAIDQLTNKTPSDAK